MKQTRNLDGSVLDLSAFWSDALGIDVSGTDWAIADCPACHTKASLSVQTKPPGKWRCKACSKQGAGAIEFLQVLRGMDEVSATRDLVAFNQAQQLKEQKQLSASQQIYEAYLSHCSLDAKHRAELKLKRGFSDATIDSLRFVSSGNKKALESLKTQFDTDALMAAGVYSKVNNAIVPASQLTEPDRVIIPYLDGSGKTILLRPHKLGLQDVRVQPYCSFLLKDKPKHIIITEGEFKAAALYQWGVPAIAIPGVSSFAGKHFERIVSMLEQHGVKRVTVIFDNEVKDNPSFPNYKQKPEDRWDTPYWAYIMGYKLSKKGFVADVGTLPDSWRKDGKVDFDMALAMGKRRQDILQVIEEAVPPSEYLDTLPEQAQRIVRRKIARYFTNSPIRREHGKYLIERKKGDITYEEQLSNFVIDIHASYFSSEGCVRHMRFVNQFGEQSDSFTMTPTDMAGPGEFKKFCFSKGNYVFEGTGTDLTEIWKFELARDTGAIIYTPEMIGEVKPGFWLFGNVAIKNHGLGNESRDVGDFTFEEGMIYSEVYSPDDDGVFWVDGVGYKPQSLAMGPKGEATQDAIPSLYISQKPKDLINEIADRLKEGVGGYSAYMGIGWVAATIFSRVIFKEFKSFPFLFPHGKREAGKSTYMRWIMAFFGQETEGTSIAESTQNYIMRALAYYSSLGVWFDEYRNEQRVTQKDGYLRSAYNRQMSGKGMKSDFGAKSYTVRGTVAISGEELPRDNGLFTRTIPLQISANRRDREHYDWLNKMSEKFSGFVYHLIVNYPYYAPKVIRAIREMKAALVEQDITDRTAENWAIIAACFDVTVKQDPEFIKWVFKECKEVKQAAEDEHMLAQFWSDVVVMESDGDLGLEHFRTIKHNDELIVWFPSVFNKWAEYYRRRTGKEPFDRMSVLKYLQDEPYYKTTKPAKLFGNVLRKSIVIDLRNENTPSTVIELAESVYELEQRMQNSSRRSAND